MQPDCPSAATGRAELRAVAASVAQLSHLRTFFAAYRHP